MVLHGAMGWSGEGPACWPGAEAPQQLFTGAWHCNSVVQGVVHWLDSQVVVVVVFGGGGGGGGIAGPCSSVAGDSLLLLL
jgi:hypothetical protein